MKTVTQVIPEILTMLEYPLPQVLFAAMLLASSNCYFENYFGSVRTSNLKLATYLSEVPIWNLCLEIHVCQFVHSIATCIVVGKLWFGVLTGLRTRQQF